MAAFDTIEDTLFVPMLGRIYASKNFPHILYDSKAVELGEKLPQNIKGKNTQTQYTLMAGAIRSANMDRYIDHFIKCSPGGVVVELGCGLETAFYRNDDGNTVWYEVDLPDVIQYRRSLLESQERDKTIAADAFAEDWIMQIRVEHSDAPLLITASGLFYYFEQDKVFELFKSLRKYGKIEVVFDTVNAKGMKQMGKVYEAGGSCRCSDVFLCGQRCGFSTASRSRFAYGRTLLCAHRKERTAIYNEHFHASIGPV